LILLDIGLPTLNGIDAARQIRKLVPNAKIIFLTQESSDDVVQEALRLGAWGYVVKTRAGSDLLAAVEAVLQGKRFVTGKLTGRYFADAPPFDDPQSQEVLAPDAPSGSRKSKIKRRHEVLFYPDDMSFLENFTRFITAALKSGDSVIIAATDSHLVSVRHSVQAQGVDVAAAVELGRYIPLDVGELLPTLMGTDLPDPVRFLKAVGDLISAGAKAANGDSRCVFACGECVPTLWARPSAEAAIRVEQLWDEVAIKYDVHILCGYRANSFDGDENRQIFQRICAEHSAVYLDEMRA
jgi:hypothetical protein